MDDSLFTADLNVASARTRDDLAGLLRIIHARADRPSLRALEDRTRHARTPLSKTVVSEMLRGARFPRKAVMLSFLRACRVPEEALEPWLRCWERVAASGQGTGSPQPPGGAGSGPHHAVPAGQHGQRDTVLDEPLSGPRGPGATATGHGPGAPLAAIQHAPPRGAPGPQVRRRELGAALRSLRSSAGMTIEQVAERLLCSPSKVSRMETGFRSGSMRDVRDLCDLYGVTSADQRGYLMELARESKRQEWWQSYDLRLPYGHFIGLEDDASSISVFHSSLVPGLLQTADYARFILKNLYAVPGDEWIDQQVEVRLRRQLLLSRDVPPALDVVVDEAALHRVAGNSQVMRAQLDRLVREAARPNISVRVVPYDHGAYRAIENSFTILEFPGEMKGVVYVEGLFGWIYLEREQDVQRYTAAFRETQSIAASDAESVKLITSVSRRLTV